jgi:CRP-like cAMP-binding protein
MKLHRKAKTELIRTIPLFADCSDDELAAVASVADEVDFAEGRQLTRQSTPGREFVVLVEGTADVLQGDQVVNRIGAGDFVGEIALVTDQPRTATVVATSAVHALVIEGHAFQQLLAAAPDLNAKVQRAAWEHLRQDPAAPDPAASP